MSDPYRITDTPAPTSGAHPAGRESRPGRTALRLLLWLGVLAGVGVNLATNFTGHTLIGILAGSFGTVCIVLLVVSHVTGRRR
ncbi:hypothetical protein [Phytomonospora endophytica]|uniref:Uncharacterized protein n=1 Tax=Phytomonospora endophytica TaxID=714109 RepID=A0A841FHP3_9ACTN|nr:hypothetical protein [Phytomonospora endophytica]MBB6032617.1 hypothetical protein [Phytomonospora endophytica]GIG66233.1 hypothetical protein Pen01_25280 [Phytomonospora endophytica]